MKQSVVTKAFLGKVREYLAGSSDWDSVHRISINLIWEKADDFPGKPATEELHVIFLTDSEDDPQFRADDLEVRRLLPLAEQEWEETGKWWKHAIPAWLRQRR